MKLYEIAGDLETVCFYLRASTQSILHTHTALTEGPNEPKVADYDVLCAIYAYQSSLLDQLHSCIEKLAQSRIETKGDIKE